MSRNGAWLRWPARRLVRLPPVVVGVCAAVIAISQVMRAVV
ncbi:MAG TPA: hypothetical protein VKB28_05360 [Solirubrobacteraceae bacterium]|nr:hypothetical protein [Solirubrobacteraceae bacterium]